MVEKADGSYGTSPGGVNYIGAIPFCSPLVPVRPSSVCFLFPCCFSPYAHHRASRLSSRNTVSPCVLFRAFRCVVPLIVSPVGSFRLVVSYERRFVLLFARSRFVCRGGFALRSHAVSFSSRYCVSSVVSSAHLVLSRHLVSVSPVSVSDPFSCLVPVFAPFSPAVRSFLFVLFGIGLCPRSWGVAVRHGHGAAGACSSHLIRPIMAPCLWRFACGGSLVA